MSNESSIVIQKPSLYMLQYVRPRTDSFPGQAREQLSLNSIFKLMNTYSYYAAVLELADRLG